MRSVLALEGVCSGAADGYARIAGKPALTLLHLGPGLSNASANLHNAKKAFSPVINLIGDHATYHKKYDAPLNSDIEGLSGPISHWSNGAHCQRSALLLRKQRRWRAPRQGKFRPSLFRLIAWDESVAPVAAPPVPARASVDDESVKTAAEWLKGGKTTYLLMSNQALCEEGRCSRAKLATPPGLGSFAIRSHQSLLGARGAATSNARTSQNKRLFSLRQPSS